MEEIKKNKNITKQENISEENKEEKIVLTKEQLSALIKNAAADAVSEYLKNNNSNNVYTERPDKLVELIYLNKVSSDNVTYLDNNKLYAVRQLGDRIHMPLNVLQSSMAARERIKSRKLIVLNGLTDYEKKLFECDYKDGEVLTIEFINNLLSLSRKDVTEAYKALCPQHRKLVAELLRDKFVSGDYKVNAELVRSLIKIAKKDSTLPEEYRYDEKILRELLRKIDKANEESDDE